VAVSVVATEVASGAGAVVEVVVVLEAAVATMKALPRKLLRWPHTYMLAKERLSRS
jgi:hypothetical protein